MIRMGKSTLLIRVKFLQHSLFRYKDGTEIASETNNELSLTSLESNDQGRYQCSAKLTADPSLPAVRSEEATLTIKGTVVSVPSH